MDAPRQSVLTVNAGSSSIKLDLFLIEPLERRFSLSLSNIGQPEGVLKWTLAGTAEQREAVHVADFNAAIDYVLPKLSGAVQDSQLAAIGHRIVHGGITYHAPVQIDEDVLANLHALTEFDPEHLPSALELITVFGQRLPNVTQVAAFDTAFFADLPRVAQILPLPRKFEALGLRRYGFHGLSYTALLANFADQAGDLAARGRIVMAHLGSGASLAALKNGKPIDTTMAFTPSSGIPMSTRSGNIDPGIVEFLSRKADVDVAAFNHMVHFESGLLGVSELSADMYALLQAEAENQAAHEAVDLFCYEVRKTIGAFSAALGGLDSIVFAGGIGENAPLIRARICEGLDYLGVTLHNERNDAQEFLISSDSSRVGVHVIHTDEARVIAEQTCTIIQEGGGTWN